MAGDENVDENENLNWQTTLISIIPWGGRLFMLINNVKNNITGDESYAFIFWFYLKY